MLEESDCPELYDLRFGSGVVREEEGVVLFRGRDPGPGDRLLEPVRVSAGSG